MPDRCSSVEFAALRQLIRDTLGPRSRIRGLRTIDEDGDYRVLRAELSHPDRAVVVKLCAQGDPRAPGFARAAACARLVREGTDVPTYDVVSVDASGTHWPWAYLVTSEIEGQPWREVVFSPEPGERGLLYEQLGRAVAGLHSVHFDGFGEIEPDEAAAPGRDYLDALAAWADKRIPDPEHAALFRRLLSERADLFADVGLPQLVHEDLNPNNLLVRLHGEGHWRLAGVLDFDKAWAGCGESDLARLELWDGMVGPGFWEGYTSLRPVPASYSGRRALYQLLWCLEYARATPRHNADTAAVCAQLGIPLVIFS